MGRNEEREKGCRKIKGREKVLEGEREEGGGGRRDKGRSGK